MSQRHVHAPLKRPDADALQGPALLLSSDKRNLKLRHAARVTGCLSFYPSPRPSQIIFHKENPGIDYEFYIPVEKKEEERERPKERERETPRNTPRERPREREQARASLRSKYAPKHPWNRCQGADVRPALLAGIQTD